MRYQKYTKKRMVVSDGREREKGWEGEREGMGARERLSIYIYNC